MLVMTPTFIGWLLLIVGAGLALYAGFSEFITLGNIGSACKAIVCFGITAASVGIGFLTRSIGVSLTLICCLVVLNWIGWVHVRKILWWPIEQIWWITVKKSPPRS